MHMQRLFENDAFLAFQELIQKVFSYLQLKYAFKNNMQCSHNILQLPTLIEKIASISTKKPLYKLYKLISSPTEKILPIPITDWENDLTISTNISFGGKKVVIFSP